MRWRFLQGRQAPVTNELVSVNRSMSTETFCRGSLICSSRISSRIGPMIPEDQGVRGPCQYLTSCFARCREISESVSGSDPSTLSSFIQYFRSMPGHSIPGCYRVFLSLFFCPFAGCPGGREKTMETVRETAAFLPVCLFVHRNRTLSSNTT